MFYIDLYSTNIYEQQTRSLSWVNIEIIVEQLHSLSLSRKWLESINPLRCTAILHIGLFVNQSFVYHKDP